MTCTDKNKCACGQTPCAGDRVDYYTISIERNGSKIPVELMEVSSVLNTGINLDSYLATARFNVMKYMWRLGRKPGVAVKNEMEKARRYLEMAIEYLKNLEPIEQQSVKPDKDAWQEKQYTDMLRKILTEGNYREVKGEPARYELFAPQSLKFDLRDGRIPLLTTKKVQWKTAFNEMFWFLQGSQDISYLKKRGVKIWDAWADENGVVGPLYGSLMRDWKIDDAVKKHHEWNKGIDQLATVMKSLRDRPDARSHVIIMWRPDYIPVQSIKPCHVYLQFYRYKNEISLQLTQRSCDAYLGVPFNIAQYAMLCHLVAWQLGCTAREFTWQGCDVHIYADHIDQVEKQLNNPILPMPTIKFNRHIEGLELKDYCIDDIEIVGYEHAEFMPAPLSIQGKPGTGKVVA